MNKEKSEELFKQLFNEDWDSALSAADQLAEESNPKILKLLISVLDTDHPQARNAAALALRDIGDNSAIDPLIKSIFKPSNKGNVSTLVYALENLNCSEYFRPIFQMALAKKADVRLSALNILSEQEFYIDSNDLSWARDLLSKNKVKINDSEYVGRIEEVLGEFENPD